MSVTFVTTPAADVQVGDVLRHVGTVTGIIPLGEVIAINISGQGEPMIVPLDGEWTAEVAVRA